MTKSAQHYQVEICVSSVQDALAAKQHGAHRIELSARLDLEGLNPSLEVIKGVCEAVDIPVDVVIRPRSGNFVYSEQEILLMLKSIKRAKEYGVSGIVSGALLEDGKLDIKTTARLIRATHPATFTFNRAFDTCWDPLYVYEILDRLGVDRLLTSGHEKDAASGINFLKELVEIKSQIDLVCSGGVNQHNIVSLWNAGTRRFQIHGSTTDEAGVHVFDHEKVYLCIEALERIA